MPSLDDYLGQPPDLSARQKALTEIELQQQQHLLNTGQNVEQLYNPTGGFQAGSQFTDLDAVVPFNADQLASQEAKRQTAASIQSLNPNIMDSINFGLNGAMDVENNPYAQGAIRAAVDPVLDGINERVIPAAQSAAIQQGAYGGSRDAFLTAQAIDDSAQGARNSADALSGQFYNRGLDTFDRTLAGLPTSLSAMSIGDNMLGEVGDTIAEHDNILRQQDIQRHDFERDMPFQRAAEFAGTLDTLYEPPRLLPQSFAQDGGDQGITGDIADVLGMLNFLGIEVGGGVDITVDNAIENVLDNVLQGGNNTMDLILDILMQGADGLGDILGDLNPFEGGDEPTDDGSVPVPVIVPDDPQQGDAPLPGDGDLVPIVDGPALPDDPVGPNLPGSGDSPVDEILDEILNPEDPPQTDEPIEEVEKPADWDMSEGMWDAWLEKVPPGADPIEWIKEVFRVLWSDKDDQVIEEVPLDVVPEPNRPDSNIEQTDYDLGLEERGEAPFDSLVQDLFWDLQSDVPGAAIVKTIGGGVGETIGNALTGQKAEDNTFAGVGATIGATVGGPVGAVIGSVIGGIADAATGTSDQKNTTMGLLVGDPRNDAAGITSTTTFPSGLEVHSVNRRGNDQATSDYVETLESLDKYMTETLQDAGYEVALDNTNFAGGPAKKGKLTEGNPQFFGSATEGKQESTNAAINKNLTAGVDDFVKGWVQAAADSDPKLAQQLRAGGDAELMLNQFAKIEDAATVVLKPVAPKPKPKPTALKSAGSNRFL